MAPQSSQRREVGHSYVYPTTYHFDHQKKLGERKGAAFRSPAQFSKYQVSGRHRLLPSPQRLGGVVGSAYSAATESRKKKKKNDLSRLVCCF